MAVLTLGVQVRQDWNNNNGPNFVALYEVRGTTSADTVDISGDFRVIKQAILLGATVNGTAVATFAGTVVTVPTGLSNDGAYLLVQGVKA